MFFIIFPGPDPGRCNRCKCIGQKKMADACIGQICTTNNYKHHSLRSARIKCVYAITHVLEFVRWYFNYYNKLRSQNLFVNSCLKEN